MQEGQKPPSDQAADQKPEWQFTDYSSSAETHSGPVDTISWTASEFIAHNKTAGWYGALVLVSVLFAAGAYLLTKDKITIVMILIVGTLFGAMAARKPRELPYSVDEKGIHIGEKVYGYANFKSFSIVQEEGVESIWFMPLQRFMPGLSIYFAPNDGDKIVDVLSEFLPVEARKLDAIDQLMHRLRF